MKNLVQFSAIMFLFFAFQSCETMDMEPNLARQGNPDNVNSVDQASNDANMRVANYVAHLSGAEEVPAVETNATGQAKLQLSMDGSELHYMLIVANIENVFAAHIHLAEEGVNGPVVAGLYGGPALDRADGVLAEGTITTDDLAGPLEGEMLSDLVAAINNGETYVNVHTSANPGGEIRGQVK